MGHSREPPVQPHAYARRAYEGSTPLACLVGVPTPLTVMEYSNHESETGDGATRAASSQFRPSSRSEGAMKRAQLARVSRRLAALAVIFMTVQLSSSLILTTSIRQPLHKSVDLVVDLLHGRGDVAQILGRGGVAEHVE